MCKSGAVKAGALQGLENEPIPQVFEPVAQNPSRLATLLVRTSTDEPLKMAGAVQAAVRRVEKYAPVYGITTLEDWLGIFFRERRFQSSLLTGFSVVALVMAAIGIYGLMQYSIAARTQEIGVRVAVGAQPRTIFRMVILGRPSAQPDGCIARTCGSPMVSCAGSSLLFGVSARDPFTFITVSLLLTATAVAACYFPARHATKVDPIVALRHE
jgi:ABC-type antimicrobial peptide transport system permease subunit